MSLRPTLRRRDSAFSYRCRACSRCCRHKRIQLNPYELARLAEHLGTTTTDVIARYTRAGTALAERNDGACVFLGPTGCTVHPARPLVCRLYPLGVIITRDGREGVVEMEPHPESEGEYGTDGTVDDYFAAQGAGPYFAAAARYHAVLQQLETAPPGGEGAVVEVPEAPAFTDPHYAVAWEVARGGPAAPADAEGLVTRHVALLDRWARALGAALLLAVAPLRAQETSILILAVNGSTNQATATWPALRGSQGYQLQRRELTVDASGRVASASAWSAVYSGTATSHTESFTRPSVLYEYQAAAALRGGPISSAVVRYAVPAFTTPTSLMVGAVGDRANVAWVAATAVTGYQVWRQTVARDGTIRDRLQRTAVPASVTTFQDQVALDGTLYQYQVVATDAAGGTWPTGWVAFQAPTAVPPVVAITGAGDRAVITWVQTPGASAYSVVRTQVDQTGRAVSGPVTVAPGSLTATTFTDIVPSPLTGYLYVVTALFTGGTQAGSAPVSYWSPAFMTPGNVMVAGGGGRVGLTWCAASGATGYQVFRRQVATDGRVSAPVQRNPTLLTITGFTDEVLPADGMVEYQVVAVGRDGRQWPSAWVRAAQ